MAEVDVPYLINSTLSRLAQNDTVSSVGSLSAFTLVKRFFTLPSRLAARVHLLEELLQEDPYVQAQAISSAYQANNNGEDAPRYSGRTPKVEFPNALGFFVSKYALSVVLMGFLLHRIYHIVTPSRRPSRGQRGSRRRSIFPLDMESTKTRLILRIPTLIALGRCMFLWLLVTLQTANLIPDNSLFDSLRQLALRTTTKNLCWQMHVSACCTVLVSAIFRGLDGPSRDSSRRPFNFAAFGYMMYIYSDPAAHVGKHGNGPSRPDIHVMIMAFLPFLELTLLHAMSVKYTWSWKRLYPTAFVSILTIIHYHYVVWLSSSNYPLLSFAGPFESVLIALILVVVGLRAFTQLVTTGAIRRPLLGSGTSLMPSADEDFVMALLRLGTVAMDTTSVAGLGNEVGVISTPETLTSSRPAGVAGPGDTVQLGIGGVEVQRDPTSRRMGFGNEIRTVRAKVMDDIDTAQPSHLVREMTAFYKALWRFITGLGRYVLARVRRRPLVVNTPRMENTDPASPPPRPRNLRLEDEDRLYERFRMGQVDDDDEDEWTPPSVERETSLAPSELSEDDDGGNDSDATIDGDDLRAQETSELYSDHTAHPTSTSLLLAHLSNTSDAPLTRRRYRRLTLGESSHSRASNDDENDDNWLSERRKDAHTRMAGKDDYEEARRRACVICTVEQRTIILWPCRCLALCEECRENMASRSGASKHSCPCCRQRVDGYSRVYIP